MSAPTSYTTTLTEPVSINDAQIIVADATGLNNPGSLSAYNQTPVYLQIGRERMEVDIRYVVGGLRVPVIRGSDGTSVLTHEIGDEVIITFTTPNYYDSLIG